MLYWSRGLRWGERGAALSLTSVRRKLPLGLGDKCAFTLDNTFSESVPRRRAGGQIPQKGHSWANTQHRSHEYELRLEGHRYVGCVFTSELTGNHPTSKYVPAPRVSCPEVQYWSWRPWIQSAVVATYCRSNTPIQLLQCRNAPAVSLPQLKFRLRASLTQTGHRDKRRIDKTVSQVQHAALLPKDPEVLGKQLVMKCLFILSQAK